eukprot:13748982-Alexandrium_andersonii.AAC.1
MMKRGYATHATVSADGGRLAPPGDGPTRLGPRPTGYDGFGVALELIAASARDAPEQASHRLNPRK